MSSLLFNISNIAMSTKFGDELSLFNLTILKFVVDAVTLGPLRLDAKIYMSNCTPNKSRS